MKNNNNEKISVDSVIFDIKNDLLHFFKKQELATPNIIVHTSPQGQFLKGDSIFSKDFYTVEFYFEKNEKPNLKDPFGTLDFDNFFSTFNLYQNGINKISRVDSNIIQALGLYSSSINHYHMLRKYGEAYAKAFVNYFNKILDIAKENKLSDIIDTLYFINDNFQEVAKLISDLGDIELPKYLTEAVKLLIEKNSQNENDYDRI